MGSPSGGGFSASGAASGISSIGGGIADLFAAGGFASAAQTYASDAQLQKESTALEEYSANIRAATGRGAVVNSYAGGNLKTSGTAIEALAEQARLASLGKSQIAVQGQIKENDLLMQERNAQGQAMTSEIGGVTGILAGAVSLGGSI